jgi:hypothetical protein
MYKGTLLKGSRGLLHGSKNNEFKEKSLRVQATSLHHAKPICFFLVLRIDLV